MHFVTSLYEKCHCVCPDIIRLIWTWWQQKLNLMFFACDLMLDRNSIVYSNGSRLFSAGCPFGNEKKLSPLSLVPLLLHPNAAQDTIWNFWLFHPRGCLFWFANHGFIMQISYRYQSADLEMDDWRMWRHEWFILVIALKICIISRSAKRAIKGVYVSLITWKWKSNYFYSILEVFHKVLWKIKKSCHLSFN